MSEKSSFKKVDHEFQITNICPNICIMGYGPNKCSYFQKFIYFDMGPTT